MKRLVSTVGLSHEEWLKYRQKGIGGSDAGAICGVNPYSSPIKVFYDKTSLTIETEENEATRVGKDLEDYVAKRFSVQTGLKIRRANAIFYDENRPYMIADFDRLIVGEQAGLECKTVNVYLADEWKDGKIPLHYQMQCYHYMSISGYKIWYIAALVMGKEFIVRKLTWDDDIIGYLRLIEESFWNDHILTGKVPAPDGSDSCDDLIKQLYPSGVSAKRIILQDFKERLLRREYLTDEIEKLLKEKKQIEQELKMKMGEAEYADSEGFRISWKNVLTNRIDTERLKSEQPLIYKEYLKPINSRKLLINAA